MAWIERRTARYRVRFRLADGTVGTDSWHPTKAAAEIRCKQVDVEQALDTYIDPTAGRITLTEWVTIWEPGHIAGPARWTAYRSHLRNHILPRFGDTPLNQITRQSIKVFVKHLKQHLADSSVASVMALFGLLMREAVAERRIPYNPCHGVRVVTQRRSAASVAAIAVAIRECFADSEVPESAYTHLVAQMPGDDPDDRVHMAAAVAGGAEAIVTWNQADFPPRPWPLIVCGCAHRTSTCAICSTPGQRRYSARSYAWPARSAARR